MRNYGRDALDAMTRPRSISWRLSLLFCMMLLLFVQVLRSSSSVNAATSSAAPGGPGDLSYFDLARKDCVGTARNTTSKVWFTLADGVLSDVYYPTIDNTNVKTLQFIVTDGSTFTDLQTRDTTYTVQELNGPTLACRVTATAKSGKYRVVTDYVTDPARNAVVMRMHFEPLSGKLSDYKFYLRYDPTINGNGGGGTGNGGADNATVDTTTGHALPVAFDTQTTTNAVNRDYGVPVYSALDASSPFTQVSNGFVGTDSDGLKQLDTSHTLSSLYSTASNGNVVQTAQADISHGGELTLGLGFGQTQADAVKTAHGAVGQNFNSVLAKYTAGWLQYDAKLTLRRFFPAAKSSSSVDFARLLNEYYLSVNVVKASEDKTFPGALVAGLASPWGQATSAGDPNNTYFGSYREVFARDLYETWTALYTDGDQETARDAVNFLFYHQQQADGSFPRNSLLNGKTAPDSFNTQLDENSYPILMADQMGMTGSDLYQNHIKRAANFVVSHGPSFGVERWEEQGGYSPSTISAEIAGLVAAADIARKNHDLQSANLWLGVADDWQRSIKKWTVTTNGPLSSQPYFIRLSKTGDPNAAITYNLGNGGPTLDQRSVIDAGFLDLVRLGELSASDKDVVNSLSVVDKTIKVQTPNGPGWYRYNGDGYGDGAQDGHPWAPSGKGTGHPWPVLAAERGEYQLAAGDASTAVSLLDTMQKSSSGVGLMPEQDWELPDLAASPYGTDPTTASIGFQTGKPDGSASPLTWAVASYVRLFNDTLSNKVIEQPQNTYNRYVAHTVAQTQLSVATPANLSSVSASPVVVTGQTAPGNTVYVSATNTDQQNQTSTVQAQVAANGSFTASLPITGGTTVLNTVAVSPAGATAHDQRTVVYDFTPGKLVYDASDPSNDDNGPGNYAYPTASDFHPGAYDIQDFRIYDDGTNIIFKLQTRDLSPTFGSPLGAQLIDVYVHSPAAGATSTAAAYPQRNYTIAPGAAWSQLIEVQGFGQRYVDASGKSLGTVQISANAISRYITFSVPKATFGTPASGWGFTVTLTGQDGYSPDLARAFTATPGAYSFGVCATASSDPHCTVDPNTVPKVMDTITPAGVNQSDELDYTKHAVVLQDITIP
ncbi:glucodextranase DOMON-like domain-containing protein [Dictyobacter kobayashii]|uniref:Glucan 1,4-alpha-glucosidase n=1 Tax=Dictyobacter kobayashii TaxID=2014872 RepID=A0A402AF26_9CHLR|nr:glucodextranase DOMON-like domain-containing protein [Dictyobacter kobayashii]GCE17695.1 glucan 1,4-alpha-glucosidase [Dictyobacter kobayashii]